MNEPTDAVSAPSRSEIISFFSTYPSTALYAISVYYPLTATMLAKYGDILWWGGRDSFDYNYWDDTTRTFVFWYPGIIFNHVIEWTDQVRSIVAGMLAFRGNELGFQEYDWYKVNYERDPLSDAFRETIRVVANCPLSTANLRMSANGLSYLPRSGDTLPISCMTWREVMAAAASESFPELVVHPELWANTLSHYLNADTVPYLLNILYNLHLHGPTTDIDHGEDLPDDWW